MNWGRWKRVWLSQKRPPAAESFLQNMSSCMYLEYYPILKEIKIKLRRNELLEAILHLTAEEPDKAKILNETHLKWTIKL